MKARFLLLVFLSMFLSQGIAQKKEDQEIKNLMALARLHGYIRFFHPSDEAAKMDWNRFALYAAKEVLPAKDEKELVAKLKKLFYPMAPAMVITGPGHPGKYNKRSVVPKDTAGYKTVVWQHLGVNLGNAYPYKTIRLNRPSLSLLVPFSHYSMATFSQETDVKPYAGKNFRLSGWMKLVTENNYADGFLWLITLKEKGGKVNGGFSEKNILKAGWNRYEISGTVEEDAKKMMFGGVLRGPGQLFIDSVGLFIEGKEGWSTVPVENGSFEDTTVGFPKGWRIGFDGNAEYAYLYEYATSPESKFGKQSLMIAPIDSTKIITEPLFEPYPLPGEFVSKKLSANSTAFIPMSLYGNKDATYPGADTIKLRVLQNEVSKIDILKATGDSLYLRLGNIIIVWNIFKHFFPYWRYASEDPETILRKALTKAFRDKTALDFKKTLELMTAPLNDGHIGVMMNTDSTGLHQPPLLLEHAEEKLVIVKVLDTVLRKTVKPGDVITAIDGVDTRSYLLEKEKYHSGSSQWKQYLMLTSLLIGKENETVKLQINGSRVMEIARSVTTSDIYAAAKDNRRKTGEIMKGVYYVDCNTTFTGSFRQLLPKLMASKAIIFDMRGYRSGNSILLNHLMKAPESNKWMFTPKISYPDYSNVSFKSYGWDLKPDSVQLNGKIVFIADGRTISEAECVMGYVKGFNLATIVGQPTAGANGNVNPFYLPGRYRISWTGMLVTSHDGSQTHIKGITPDIFVQRTIKGIRDGQDELLEKAIEIVKQAEK